MTDLLLVDNSLHLKNHYCFWFNQRKACLKQWHAYFKKFPHTFKVFLSGLLSHALTNTSLQIALVTLDGANHTWETGCSFILNHFLSLLHITLWFVQRCLILNGTEWNIGERDFKLKWSRWWLSSSTCHHSSEQQGLLRTIREGERSVLTSFMPVMMCRSPSAKSLRKCFSFQLCATVTYCSVSHYRKVDIFMWKPNKINTYVYCKKPKP